MTTARQIQLSDITLLASGVLAKSGASAAHTGDTTETTLATINIPANSIGANGVLRITSFWSCTNNGNTKTARHKLGATTIASAAVTTIANILVESKTIAANATNAQNTLAFFPRGTDMLLSGAFATSAIDMTSAQTLTITGQCVTSGTDTITLLGYVVEIVV